MKMLICIAFVQTIVYSKWFNYKEFLKKGVLVMGTVGKKIALKQKKINFLKNASK